MSLKAVLFDLGLTLTKTASFPEIYRTILARFGVEVSVEDVVWAQKETEKEADTSSYSAETRKEFWTNYNTVILEKLGVKENTSVVASQIDELWWECSHLQLYPDTEPTLSGLKAKGLKLALVSNGFEQDLEYVLGKTGLKKWFDVIVCIDSCNCAKPGKQIFLYTLNELGIKPNEAVFVGNSVVYDYEGAQGVGIKPLLLDREGKLPSKYDKIASLTELLALV